MWTVRETWTGEGGKQKRHSRGDRCTEMLEVPLRGNRGQAGALELLYGLQRDCLFWFWPRPKEEEHADECGFLGPIIYRMVPNPA